MPSLDIVSELEIFEVNHAVQNTQKEIATRFDFRGQDVSIDINEKNKEIKISTKDLLIEQYFEVPNGKIGFANLEDSKPPKMIKYGKNGKILWAIEFRDNDSIGIPFYKLSKMELNKTDHGYIFEFFNHSYSEPGYICVDEDFNLKYMCLKAF